MEVGPGWIAVSHERPRMGLLGFLVISFIVLLSSIFVYATLVMLHELLFGADDRQIGHLLIGVLTVPILPVYFLRLTWHRALVRRFNAKVSRVGDVVHYEQSTHRLGFISRRQEDAKRSEVFAKVRFHWFGIGGPPGGRGGWRYSLDLVIRGKRHTWLQTCDGGLDNVERPGSLRRAAETVSRAMQAADVIDRIEFGKPYVDKGIPGAPQS